MLRSPRHTLFFAVVLLGLAKSTAAQGFLTETFGNSDRCVYSNTLTVGEGAFRFDVTALPKSL